MAQLIHNQIRIAQQLHVEPKVLQLLPIDQDLGHVRRQRARNQRHRTHLERRAHHDQQIAALLIPIDHVMKLIGQTLAEEHNVRLHDAALHQLPRLHPIDVERHRVGGHRVRRHRIAQPAHGYRLAHDVVADLARLHAIPAASARSGGERTVALDHVLDARDALQRIDVLCVVAQQSALLFERPDEAMRRGRIELARIDFASELVERARVVGKVADVEHGLGVGHFGVFVAQAGVDAVAGAEIGNAARDGDAGSGEDEDATGAAEELDDVLEGVDVSDGLTAWRFGDDGGDDAPEFGIGDVGGGGGQAVGQVTAAEEPGEADARMDAGLDLLVDLGILGGFSLGF